MLSSASGRARPRGLGRGILSLRFSPFPTLLLFWPGGPVFIPKSPGLHPLSSGSLGPPDHPRSRPIRGAGRVSGRRPGKGLGAAAAPAAAAGARATAALAAHGSQPGASRGI